MKKESKEWPGLMLTAWLDSLWIRFSVGSVDNKDPSRGGAWPDELSVEPTAAVERHYTTSLPVQTRQSILFKSNAPLPFPIVTAITESTGDADIQ